MKVLFLSVKTEKIKMNALPFGLACVAAATRKAGHKVAMLDLANKYDRPDTLRAAIAKFHPEIIGLTVRNIDDQNIENPRFLLGPVKTIIEECRRVSNAKIVLGGAGYSIFPESALSFLEADMGIQGEGEVSFPALLARMELGANLAGVPGLYMIGHDPPCQRGFVRDLDTLPLPDPDLWPMSSTGEDLWLPVQTRRGCALGCSYCSTAVIEGRAMRKRSPEAVVRWIARWREGGAQRVYFVDNTFNLPPSYAKEICRELLDHGMGIKWWSILYPKRADKGLLELMAKSGCEQVALGFESGSERILRNMNKRFTREDVRQVSDGIAEQGIRQMGFLLLGSPGETRDSVEESLAFADSLKLDALKITIGVRIYPGTSLAKRALGEGVISAEDNLLFPRFYLAKGLEGWLSETLKAWMRVRPHWMF